MVKLPKSLLEEIRAHAEEVYPHECCGILLGLMNFESNEREATLAIRCGNMCSDSPENRYSIDPRELIAAQQLARERGEDIIGFYHSHPDHPPRWSPTDFAEAHWIGCSYVITSVNQGKADVTKSFALRGTTEEDKYFEQEPIAISEARDVSSDPARASLKL